MNRSKSTRLRTAAAALTVLVLLCAVFIIFRDRLNERLRYNEEQHLIENAGIVSEVFYTKLDGQLTMLESQARYFQNIDLNDYNAMKHTILSLKGIGGFKHIGVANASGATINYNGTSSGNIYLSGYYQEAMQGQNAVSASTIIDEEGDEVLVLAVPILKDGIVAGVIYGTFTKDTIDAIIDSISVSKSTTSIVVNSEGKILACTTDGEVEAADEYLTDVIPGGKLPADGKAKTMVFREDGEDHIVEMVPIGLHDWYYIMILPETTVTYLTDEITVYVGFVVAAVAVIVVFILLLIISLQRKTAVIYKKATSDPLTHILNKEAFRVRFSEEMDKKKDGLAMFIIDLDDFKAVNDNLGHVMGDKVLVDTADTLSELFGSRENVGRIGGDEFSALLWYEEDQDLIVKKAADVCSGMNKVYSSHGKTVNVSVSVGISLYSSDGSDYEALYRNADSALYEVKRSGKNRYAVFRGKEQENA